MSSGALPSQPWGVPSNVNPVIERIRRKFGEMALKRDVDRFKN
jgi:hypothetical protein